MYCGNCGTKLDDSASFCSECGTGTGVSAAQEDPTEMQAEPLVLPVAEATEETLHQTVKRANNAKWIVVLAVLLIIVISAGVAVLYFNSDGYHFQKNMELAQKALLQEDYDSAKEYYEDALEYDDTLTEAYLSIAEAYERNSKTDAAVQILKTGMKKTKGVDGAEEKLLGKMQEIYLDKVDYYCSTADYDKALDILEEAIREIGGENLLQKRVQIYENMFSLNLVNEEYTQALEITEEAYAITNDRSFLEKKADIYLRFIKEYVENAEYNHAILLIEEGYRETASAKLKDYLATVYEEWINNNLTDGYYGEAMRIAEEAYEATKEDIYLDKKIDIYLQLADAYINSERFADAIETLEKGLEETGAIELKEKLDKVKKQTSIVYKKCTDLEGNITEYCFDGEKVWTGNYFDKSGNLYQQDFIMLAEDGNVMDIMTTDGKESIISNTHFQYEKVEGESICNIKVLDAKNVVKQECTKDPEGNIVEYKEYASNGKLIMHKTYDYEYDAEGNILSYNYSDELKGEKYRYEYKRDIFNNGIKIEIATYNEEGALVDTTIRKETYNDNRLIIVEIYDGEGTLTERYYTKYDDMGSIVYEENAIGDEILCYYYEYEYEYKE